MYCEQPSTGSLVNWVECGWSIENDSPVTGYPVLPDGCIDFVYIRSQGLRAIGAMTAQQRFHFSEGASVAGVRFRPGMAGPFLGVSPAELTDGSVPLEDLWPPQARELTRRLDDATSPPEMMRILLGDLRMPFGAPNPVQQAIGAIVAAHGNVDLDGVAAQANLSSRQFRRRCLSESGLTPKLLCRILRFQHACRFASKDPRPNWASIALEAEYFDQAHLIRDFQDFTGLTPMAVFSNTRSGGIE